MSPRRKQQHRMQHNVSLPAWSDAPELVKDGVLHVSIHVPAWGATTEFLAMRLPTMFQSTLPRGERLTTTQTIYLRYLFQSTLPRGERLYYEKTYGMQDKFQSTLPRGERHLRQICSKARGLFQSTLPRGERPPPSACMSASSSFNPRSRVGSDLLSCPFTS